MGDAVGQGIPAQPLALALVVRIEQDAGADVDQAVREEVAFVRQSLGLPAPQSSGKVDASPQEGSGGAADQEESAPPVAETPVTQDAEEDKPVVQAPVAGQPERPAAKPKPSQKETPAAEPQKKQGRVPVAAKKRVEWARLEGSIRSFLGTPYVWGGETRRGTDCSGFTQTVYQEQGVSIPRVSRDQHGFLKRGKALVGGPKAQKKLGRGALVFFNKNGRGRITHVGVFMGGGKFAHASSSRGVVISDFNKRYYQKLFVDGGHVCPVN